MAPLTIVVYEFERILEKQLLRHGKWLAFLQTFRKMTDALFYNNMYFNLFKVERTALWKLPGGEIGKASRN